MSETEPEKRYPLNYYLENAIEHFGEESKAVKLLKYRISISPNGKTEIVPLPALLITEIKEKCCEYWEKAHGPYTYADSSEPLIDEDNFLEYPFPPVRFCPWCGAAKTIGFEGDSE